MVASRSKSEWWPAAATWGHGRRQEEQHPGQVTASRSLGRLAVLSSVPTSSLLTFCTQIPPAQTHNKMSTVPQSAKDAKLGHKTTPWNQGNCMLFLRANSQKVEQMGIYKYWSNQLQCKYLIQIYISKHTMQISQCIVQNISVCRPNRNNQKGSTTLYAIKIIYTPRNQEPVHARRST
jgi:hypothetical protein